jgi:hypothetical protein
VVQSLNTKTMLSAPLQGHATAPPEPANASQDSRDLLATRRSAQTNAAAMVSVRVIWSLLKMQELDMLEPGTLVCNLGASVTLATVASTVL